MEGYKKSESKGKDDKVSSESTFVKQVKPSVEEHSVRCHGPKVVNGLQPVITEDGKHLFLVPVALCKDFSESKYIRIKVTGDVVSGETWAKEIEKMLPSRSEIAHNVLLSLWAVGLHTREDAEDSSKLRNATRTAYPYKFII